MRVRPHQRPQVSEERVLVTKFQFPERKEVEQLPGSARLPSDRSSPPACEVLERAKRSTARACNPRRLDAQQVAVSTTCSQVTTSFTWRLSVEVKIMVNSGIRAPAMVPSEMMVESTHQRPPFSLTS